VALLVHSPQLVQVLHSAWQGLAVGQGLPLSLLLLEALLALLLLLLLLEMSRYHPLSSAAALHPQEHPLLLLLLPLLHSAQLPAVWPRGAQHSPQQQRRRLQLLLLPAPCRSVAVRVRQVLLLVHGAGPGG
jgi:hypothetical protein